MNKNNKMLRSSNIKTTEKGLTLIETLFAVLLLIIGIVGVYAVISQIIVFTDAISSRLTAIYLAQEGIEIVINFRDGNWLEGVVWHAGLLGCVAGCEVDFDDPVLTGWIGGGRYLQINGGFFIYDTGVATPFKREIIIIPERAPGTPPGNDYNILKVSVRVFWRERGRDHQVVAETHLYNWR